MSAFSTCDITKNDAIQEIMRGVLNASDRQLESMMFDLYGDETLQNYSIVHEYSKDEYVRQFRPYYGDE